MIPFNIKKKIIPYFTRYVFSALNYVVEGDEMNE